MPRRSELFTEDPFYLPRYCGYLPQYKYRIGKTYGRHSVEILTDPNVSKSGRYVLTPTESHPTDSIDERRSRLRSRADSWGNQNLTEEMVPGYTGYIPKKQHYFANTYGEVCRSALSHHESEQGDIKNKQTELKKVLAMQTGSTRPNTEHDKSLLTSRYHTPLPPHRAEPDRYTSQQEFKPYGSPYFMDNGNRMKWFKSGYTGFVPRSRELISLGYPAQSNKGLSLFTDGLATREKINASATKIPLNPVVKPKKLDKSAIYPTDRGMVPHYTGYIPGYKYSIGHTYGQHTHNTLKLPPTNNRSLTVA
nr:protein FAM166B-like [Ciona intestinalis]|eukprot:XP_002125298.1 protein FAM166B-like [Ciona intestinalis]